MLAPVDPTRTLRWWAIVYAFAVTPIDFGTLELAGASSGPDLAKWMILLPAWFVPVALVTPRWSALLEVLGRPPLSWLLLWAGLGVISVAWAIERTQAVIMGLGMFGLIILASWYVYNEGWYNFATAATTGLGLFLAAGIVFDVANGQLVNGTVEGRSIGLSTGPTTQGRLGSYIIVLGASLLAFNRSRHRPMALTWMAIGTGFVALVFAETRTAILAVVLGLLYGGLRRFPPLDRWLIVGGLGILLAAAYGVGSSFIDLAGLSQRNDPTSASGRTEIWPVIFDFIRERPILGYGWGAEESLLTIAAREGSIDFLAFNTHSIALSPLISGGVIGFSMLACAIGGALRRRRRVNPWIIAMLIMVLFNGLAEALVHRPTPSVMILAGVMAAIARVPRSGQRPHNGARSAYLRHAGTGLAGDELQSLHR